MSKGKYVAGYNTLPDGRNVWLVQADDTDGGGWRWSEFLPHYKEEDPYSWGGPSWIRSVPSAKRVREEFEKGDIALCYQAAPDQAILGIARIGSTGYATRRRKRVSGTEFDLDWGCHVQPISWDQLKAHPVLKRMEKARFAQGTVFRVSARELRAVLELTRPTEIARSKAESALGLSWSASSTQGREVADHSNEGSEGHAETLTLATTPSDVVESTAVFNATLSRHSHRARSVLRRTRYWVHCPGRGEFGPSKFVAFVGINFPLYERALSSGVDGDRFDGHVTQQALESVTGSRYEASDSLTRELEQWAREALGPDVFEEIDKSRWRFLTVPGEAARHLSTGRSGSDERAAGRRERRGTQRKSDAGGTRATVEATWMDLRHNRIQNELLPILQQQYGKKSVSMEEDYIDFLVRLPGRSIFVEVKSDDDARDALKKALGQLLYYAHFDRVPGDPDALDFVVIAPGKSTCEVETFVKTLNQTYALPIRYVSYEEGSGRIDL